MIHKIYKENGEALPAYIAILATDTPPAGFVEVSDILEISNLSDAVLDIDYKAKRDIIKELIALAGGFSALNEAEKLAAAVNKIGTHAERLAAVGGDVNTLVNIGLEYHKKVVNCRVNRLAYAVSAVHNHLEHIIINGFTAPEIILKDILPYNYVYTFENLGLGGICDGDNAAGLFDYFNNTSGSIWEATGARSKPWAPEGLPDMPAFCNKILNILQKGIY